MYYSDGRWRRQSLVYFGERSLIRLMSMCSCINMAIDTTESRSFF